MRRHLRAATAAVVATAVLAIAGTATAAPAHDHTNFGSHVSHHARTMGFDGDHNPGMHQGAAGWDHGMH
jgi:hypothetical protein